MNIRFSIAIQLAALLAGCSPEAESGLTKQEIQDITAVVMQQTKNDVVGAQRESTGDVTVWTAPLRDATNTVGTTFTVRRQASGWTIVSQKQERLND